MTGTEAGSATMASGEAAPTAIAWYIGRDGQQYGPVGDPEFRKLFEAGQVLPTDLIWREGLPEWVPAHTLRPPSPPSPPPVAAPPPETARPVSPAAPAVAQDAARPTPQAKPQRPQQPRGKGSRDAQSHERREPGALMRQGRQIGRKLGRGVAWAAIVGFFVVTLGAAYFVVSSDKSLLRMATALIPSFGERVITTAPIGGFTATIEGTDQALQRSLLWQVLKKYHAEWYAERVKEAAADVRNGKPEGEIVTSLMQAVVELRRKYAGDASSAPIVRLKSIATMFAHNLVRLRAKSVEACFQFISTGEGSPEIVALLRSPEHSSAIQAQLAATFEGINEGRKTPRVYPQPYGTDYDVLVQALESRGWKKQDMRLFADSQALAKAPPETVCRLVTEWFESQLSISEPDVQMRLITDSLKPVVAG